MKTYTIRLLKKEAIARDTYAFYFEKPGEFSFQAGQYISLCVDTPEIAMPGGTMRELSVASAPHEDELILALRFRESPAKRQFLNLQPGDTAFLQGPFGSFTLTKAAHPIVFLAGGIGIVPFLSMLKQALFEHDTREFYLFSSNRRHDDIPFRAEIEALAQQTDNLTVVSTLTSDIRDGHEQGYISPLLIRKYLTPFEHAAFYLSGPQRFVGGMWEVLEETGIAPSAIHGEEFTGY